MILVVGGGISGLTAAYLLAKEGAEVIVIERGDHPGSKNMTGGRLYIRPLKRILSDLFDDAPFERWVTKERITIMTHKGSVTFEYTSPLLVGESATVLRATFDKWLATKVQQAGGLIIPQKKVTALVIEENKVEGIEVDGEKLYADMVIIADGVLSPLGEQAGLRSPLTPKHLALGLKEIIQLPSEEINRRFNVNSNEGVANLFIGSVTHGRFGGGFLYTNRESLSLGIVISLEELSEQATPSIDTLLEEFKNRSEIRTLIDKGRTLEYSAHLIPEGSFEQVKRLYGDGVLLTGDAAGFAINHGITVRGMDLAFLSGVAAAKAALEAIRKNDFSSETLRCYRKYLEELGVLKELRKFKTNSEILRSTRGLYTKYPSWCLEMFENLFRVGEIGREKLGTITMKHLKKLLLDFRFWRDILKVREL